MSLFEIVEAPFIMVLESEGASRTFSSVAIFVPVVSELLGID
jgi:hypothetical protein